MSEKKLRFRIGVFVLVAFVLLAGLIYLFGLFPTLFRTVGGDLFYVEFTDAPGVVANTPVRRSGVRVGQVEKVKLDDETGKVLVTVRVQRDYTVRRSEEPTLTSGIVSGDTSIDFIPKDPMMNVPLDRTPIPAGSVIEGKLAVNVSQLLASASRVVPPAQEALLRISVSLERLEKMAPLAEDAIKEIRDLSKETRGLVPTARDMGEEIRKLARDIRDFVPDARRTNTEAQNFIKDMRALVPDVKKTNDELYKLIQSVNDTVKDFQKTLDGVNKLIKNIDETVPVFRDTLKEIQVTTRNWGQVGEQVNVLLRTNTDRINNIVKGLEDVFSEDNRSDLATILRNLSQSSRRFPALTEDTQGAVKDFRQLTTRATEPLKRLDEVLDTVQRSTKPGGDGGILKNLEEASINLNRTMADVRELVRLVAQSDGSLKRFISDPSLYNQLDDAAGAVSRILPRLDRIRRTWRGSPTSGRDIRSPSALAGWCAPVPA